MSKLYRKVLDGDESDDERQSLKSNMPDDNTYDNKARASINMDFKQWTPPTQGLTPKPSPPTSMIDFSDDIGQGPTEHIDFEPFRNQPLPSAQQHQGVVTPNQDGGLIALDSKRGPETADILDRLSDWDILVAGATVPPTTSMTYSKPSGVSHEQQGGVNSLEAPVTISPSSSTTIEEQYKGPSKMMSFDFTSIASIAKKVESGNTWQQQQQQRQEPFQIQKNEVEAGPSSPSEPSPSLPLTSPSHQPHPVDSLDSLLQNQNGLEAIGQLQQPQQVKAATFEDLFSDFEDAAAPVPHQLEPQQPSQEQTSPSNSLQRSESGPQGEAPGDAIDPRQLLIYAVPLIKDKLVFLPVTAWTIDPEEVKSGISGKFKSGIERVTDKVSNWWNSLKEKDPETLSHKLYKEGEQIMQNMSAEERLMNNIPKNAQKIVVYHPASVQPCDVQEQLAAMTASYCVKSLSKATVAGILLPVAVGLEVIAVPGCGWFALYQLYKQSASAVGGQRLKGYLGAGADVRVNYAGDVRLDRFAELSSNAPEGVLSPDEVEELCHDIQEGTLLHPLMELRNRYVRRHIKHKSDYALLPADGQEGPHGVREN